MDEELPLPNDTRGGTTPDGGTRPDVPDQGEGTTPTGPGVGGGGGGTPSEGGSGPISNDPVVDPTDPIIPPPILPGQPTTNIDTYTILVRSNPTGASVYLDDQPSGKTTNSSFDFQINRNTSQFRRHKVSVQSNNATDPKPLLVEYVATTVNGTGGRRIDVRTMGGVLVSSTTGSFATLDFDVSVPPIVTPTTYRVVMAPENMEVGSILINGATIGLRKSSPRDFTFPSNATVVLEHNDIPGYTAGDIKIRRDGDSGYTSLPLADASLGGGPGARVLNVTSNSSILISYVAQNSDGPVITYAPSSATFTIPEGQETKIVQLPLRTLRTNTVRVTIPEAGYRKEFAVARTSGQSDLTISLSYLDDFKSKGYGLGQYTVHFTPIGDGLLEGPTLSMPLTFSGEQLVPYIESITYPNIVKIEPYKNNNTNFKIRWTTVDADYVQIRSQYLNTPNLSPNGEYEANYKSLEQNGARFGSVRFTLTPFKGSRPGDTKEISIFFEQPPKLPRPVVVNEFVTQYDALINFDPRYNEIAEGYRWLRNLLNSGDDNNHLITTWIPDNVSFEYEPNNPEKAGSIILKLYDPLPSDIEVNDQFWISFQESYPYIDSVILSDQTLQDCIPLRPYDSDVEIEGIDHWNMGYETFNELVSSGSATSANIINQYLSGSGVRNLGIDYSSYDNFVHFSSAKERLTNFRYKLQLIESYDDRILDLDTSPATGSYTSIIERQTWVDRKNAVIGGFDGYESYLYEGTSSTSWPKSSGTTNYHSTASASTTWYASQSAVATSYDNDNGDYLVNNLPVHITNDVQNDSYTLFVDMIGHHYDILWTHINGLRSVKTVTNKTPGGVPDDLVHHMLKSLGWKVKTPGNVNQLWRYAFGQDEDGNILDSIAGENYNQEVWRRILNNLPYLLKHKGTARGIRALVTCYGIPASILSIREFGGPTPNELDNATVSGYKFEEYTTALNFISSSVLTVPWVDTSNGHEPDAIEFRLRTPSSSNYTIAQNTSGDWSLKYISTTSSYGLGKVQLTVSGSPTTVLTSSELPLYNGEFYSILINRTSGSGMDDFEMFVKSAYDGTITHVYSGSIGVTGSGWENDSTITIGSGSEGSFTGQIDEFKMWNVPISESIFNGHVLFPESIEGNHISSSTEDLEFRLNFNNPKNEGTSGNTFISSSSPTTTYATFATASGFTTSSAYPYSYYTHVRVNNTKVPDVGGTRYYNNKVRFETQNVVGELSPFGRATVRSFDRSPVDLNRAGIFFSPSETINKDILRAFGGKNLTNYIADPENIYEDGYRDLEILNRYYWERFSSSKPDIWDYIRLIRYFDASLFDHVKSMVPARTQLTTGLLIEPTMLEKHRGYKHRKPSREELHHNAEWNYTSSFTSVAEKDNYETSASVSRHTSGSGDKVSFTATGSPEIIYGLTGSNLYHESIIDLEVSQSLTASFDTYTNDGVRALAYTSSVQQDIGLFMTSPIGFDTEVPVDPFWGVPQTRFGIFANSGSTTMLYLKDGMIRRRRVKVETITETTTWTIRRLVSGSDQSGPYQNEIVSSSVERLNIIDITGSHTVGSTLLDGYSFPHHYKFTKDITTGMENSFYYGVTNSISTTIDGKDPIETFETNPNQLKVNKVGRDQGEPILEVDG